MVIGGALVIAGQLGSKKNINPSNPATNSNQQSQPAQQTQAGSSNTGGAPITEKLVNITLTSSGFEPQTKTIEKGSRVIWLNKSGETASLNSADHPTHRLYPALNLGEFANGSSVQLIFDKSGTYKYHNHLKPSQTGTIIVQ